MADPLRNAFVVFFTWLPRFVAAIVILIVGYFIAKIIETLVVRGLKAANLDRRMASVQGGSYIQRIVDKPSTLIGSFSFWVIMLATISLSLTTLGIGALTAFVSVIYGYLPNVLAAGLIFIVAGLLAAGAGAFVAKTMGESMTGKVVATTVPLLIMSLAGFMILEQLRIAPGIVLITYTLILGSVSLGLALAFGLGGRDVASRLLEKSYEKGLESAGQVRADIQRGSRAQRETAGAFFEQATPDDEQSRFGKEVRSSSESPHETLPTDPGRSSREGGPDGIIQP